MRLKYPIEYEIGPKRIDKGIHWVTLRIKNVGGDSIKDIDAQLNSTDSYNIKVLDSSKYLSDLKPQEEEVVPFQISAVGATGVYASLSGTFDGEYFHWESPTLRINVGENIADIRNLFVLSHPYIAKKETVEVEAVIHGNSDSEGLTLELWTDKPSGEFEEIAEIETKNISSGEDARYSAEITPEETGLYEIYAYLFDGNELIGRKTDSVVVTG